jgi:hypothetical protein
LFNTTSRNYDLVVSTATHSNPGGCGLGTLYNGAFDWIEADSNTCNAICSPLPVGDYIIRIANKFIKIERTGGDIYDIAFQYEDGEMSVYMSSGGFNFYGPYTWTDYSILLKNNFASGDMWINNLKEINIPIDGIPRTREATTFPHTITAIDNQTPTDGYKRLWYRWSDNNVSLTRILNSVMDFSAVAEFKKEFKVTFRNYYGGSGSTGGVIKVRNNQVSSPSVDNLVTEGFSISAEALDQTINYIYLTLDYWSESLGTSASVNPTPNDNKTYTAYLKGKPVNGYRNLSFNTNEEGQPVKVTWSKYPLDNTDVTQYTIYRKVTTSGTPTLLTTVNANGSGSYTYTDYDYAISSGENKILLFYDVRAYYSPSSIYSDPSFDAVYGFYNINKQPDDITQNQTSLELPISRTVSNYPNPFNPTTTISYQLPEKSFVTLKVFDILGKEVAILVNETKSAGYHSVIFDAGHSERGRGMTSGVYIYTLSANGIVQTKKMLLAK